MIPQGPAMSRLSVNYTETTVRPPAGLGNMDEWEKCDLGQGKEGDIIYIAKHLHFFNLG